MLGDEGSGALGTASLVPTCQSSGHKLRRSGLLAAVGGQCRKDQGAGVWREWAPSNSKRMQGQAWFCVHVCAYVRACAHMCVMSDQSGEIEGHMI